jgi:hypothetical protein
MVIHRNTTDLGHIDYRRKFQFMHRYRASDITDEIGADLLVSRVGDTVMIDNNCNDIATVCGEGQQCTSILSHFPRYVDTAASCVSYQKVRITTELWLRD